jgi:hypothetical protein
MVRAANFLNQDRLVGETAASGERPIFPGTLAGNGSQTNVHRPQIIENPTTNMKYFFHLLVPVPFLHFSKVQSSLLQKS